MKNHVPRPRSVEYAVYFGIAAYLMGFVYLPFGWSQSVEAVGLMNQLLIVLIPAIIFAGLYCLAYTRKNWARIILLVLLAISFPGYATSLAGTGSGVYKITQFFQMAFFGASFVMFILKPSRAWYKDDAS